MSLVQTVQINLKETETLVQRVLSYISLMFCLEVLKDRSDYDFFFYFQNESRHVYFVVS